MSDKKFSITEMKSKIDNIYNVLTTKQKSQLRVLMDLQEGKG